MAPKPRPLDLDYLVREYRAGSTVGDLARELGIPAQTLYRRLHVAGIDLQSIRPIRHPNRRIPVPVDKLVHEYLAGASINELAKLYGASRRTIERRLREAGVPLRSRSEAEKVKWSKMSEERRQLQVAAAHAASLGKPKPLSTKVKHALTVQERKLHISPTEVELAEMLAARGITVVHQQAIGPYNCDLGAYPVAVEVFGGHWHWHGRHLLRSPERFRYILDAGWHVLVVVVDRRRYPLSAATADYVAAFIEHARRNPSIRREYRVIRGAGELLAAGCADDDEIAIIPALRRRHNARG